MGKPTEKGWVAVHRPRERLLYQGAGRLSDAQLLAVLLGTGGSGCSALELAEELLMELGGLDRLARASVRELVDRRHMGPAKAGRVVAAFELARRVQEEPVLERVAMHGPADAVRLVGERLRRLDRECFETLLLDTKCRVIGQEVVSIGHLSGAPAHPREVFKPAIVAGAASVILVHNHPSGDPTPSQQDVDLTRRLATAGRLLGVEVTDHVVIGNPGYVSLREQGLMRCSETW
ncbi:MAG: DNA repair protein RadC [Limnochordaceae bacterium]|nr:DNA repair protein RadC [Limnochordaceae bacterium]